MNVHKIEKLVSKALKNHYLLARLRCHGVFYTIGPGGAIPGVLATYFGFHCGPIPNNGEPIRIEIRR